MSAGPQASELLVASHDVAGPFWRVAQRKYGPLNPQPAPAHAQPGVGSGRFDRPGLATVYLATTARGAYFEALAYAAWSEMLNASPSEPGPADGYQELFSEDENPEEYETVAGQWERDGGRMSLGQIPCSWREARAIWQVHSLDVLDVVDVGASGALSFLRATAQQWAPPDLIGRARRLEVRDLTGADRALTTAAAEWIGQQTLPNGRHPAGIRYVSRHGTDLTCLALWLSGATAVDTQEAETVTGAKLMTTDIPGREILARDPELGAAADGLGVRVH